MQNKTVVNTYVIKVYKLETLKFIFKREKKVGLRVSTQG